MNDSFSLSSFNFFCLAQLKQLKPPPSDKGGALCLLVIPMEGEARRGIPLKPDAASRSFSGCASKGISPPPKRWFPSAGFVEMTMRVP